MCLTNRRPSLLWHCWLGHLTRNIVSEMTCNVSSGTLNTTTPYYTIADATLEFQQFENSVVNQVNILFKTGDSCIKREMFSKATFDQCPRQNKWWKKIEAAPG